MASYPYGTSWATTYIRFQLLDGMTSGISARTVGWFLTGWLLINLIQSARSELHYDESYYWVFSRFLDWGYYDHPPMVALFIRLGSLLLPGELGVRLVSVLTNTAAIFVLWKMVSRYTCRPRLFILLYGSLLIFHVYSFITTPDTPLFFFTVLFFYVLYDYLREDKPQYVWLLGMLAAGMLYSKYHAVLVFGFTILAHWRLLCRPSFWLITLLAIVLFLPHILWQIGHDYPSVQYHLFDRTAVAYRFSFTTDFVLGQLLIVGPLTGVFLYYYVYRQPASDTFLRILKVNCVGFLLFFLATSFRSRVEAHWTLLAFIPFFVLAYLYLAQKERLPIWLTRLLYVNIALIVLVRLLLILPPIPALAKIKGLRQFWGKRAFAEQLHTAANGHWLIMDNGFQDISNYNFTNNTLRGFAYNTRDYRKTQYDYWPLEDSLRNRGAYFASFHRHVADRQDSIVTNRGTVYLLYIDSVRTYQKVPIIVRGLEKRVRAGTLQRIQLEIRNPYGEKISFSNQAMEWPCFIEYGFARYIFERTEFKEIAARYRHLTIPPGGSTIIDATIRMPETPGDHLLMFSIRTAPFAGSRNSRKIPITVLGND